MKSQSLDNDAPPRLPPRRGRLWRRSLLGLALTLLLLLVSTPPSVADAEPRPPGAAEGINLSEEQGNPLLSPALRPVAELRYLLREASGNLPDVLRVSAREMAFRHHRNGAVVYLDPTSLTTDQIVELMSGAATFNVESGKAWRTTPVPVASVRPYLKPEVAERLERQNATHVVAISALNVSGEGEDGDVRVHSEEVIENRLRERGIGQEAKILAGSERQQCGQCSSLYPQDTPTVYAYPYDLSVSELARRPIDIDQARQHAAPSGPQAQDRAEERVKAEYREIRRNRNAIASRELQLDLDAVPDTLEAEREHLLTSVFAVPECEDPIPRSLGRPAPAVRNTENLTLVAAGLAADPCGDHENYSAGGAPATGLGDALAAPGTGAGGIDFSSLELRYLADPGDESGLRYSFSADLAPLTGDARTDTGRAIASETSDAFFVWLSLRPSDFWVNLNPEEPDRIVDDQLGRTDAGRVLLEADLRMKQTIGELIHPHSGRGRRFWDGVRGDCMSFRTWILPAPASVHQDGDQLYILDAPLDVRAETEYLEETGVSGATGCPGQDQATEEHNEEHFRSLILPELKEAINTAPEYAELRNVYLARVAAEWYRELSRQRDTSFGHLVEAGDIDPWQTTADWEPTDTFNEYVDSYTDGEFDVTEETTEGGTTYVRSYVYGGVDLTSIPFEEIPHDRFTADFPGLSEKVEESLTEASFGDDATVLLGAPTPRQAAEEGPSDNGSDWYAYLTSPQALLVVLLTPFAAVLLWRWSRLSTKPAARASRHRTRTPF